MKQRELKFRAYNPTTKDMLYSFEAPSLGVFFIGVQIAPETVIMQSMELLDKNGVEIYDGDIVKFHYFYGSLGDGGGFVEAEHTLTGKIVWGNFGWAIEAIAGTHWEGYTGYCAGEGESSILDLFAMNEGSTHDESFEVLGNIYTMPHLLPQ